MSRITDYGFLFQTTFGTSKTNLVNNIQLSQMNSSSTQFKGGLMHKLCVVLPYHFSGGYHQ